MSRQGCRFSLSATGFAIYRQHLTPVPTTIAHPVKTLREHSTNFEAALSVCLADPKVKAVHKLRTESRRLEAQIVLLRAMKRLPTFRSEAAKALAQIKKLRQAAGRVRDFDVQSGRLYKHAKRTRAGSLSEEEKLGAVSDIETMLALREKRRSRAAAKLVAEIETRQAKMAAALEKLNAALKPAAWRSLAVTELLAITQREFARTRALRLRQPSADDLHTIRKAAKQARYLAENAESVAATAGAKRYEHLQELGGEWHDWLELAAAARRELGRRHAVTIEFVTLRDGSLRRFRAALEQFLQPQTAVKRIASSAKK